MAQDCPELTLLPTSVVNNNLDEATQKKIRSCAFWTTLTTRQKKHLFVFDFCSKKREYKNWRTETIGENALLQLQLVSFLPSARLMRLHANVSSQFENSAQQFFHRLRSIRTHHSLSSGNLLFGRSKVKNGNRLGFAKLLLMT